MAQKTPKSYLSELLVANRLMALYHGVDVPPEGFIPVYQTFKVGGQDHTPIFSSTVSIPALRNGFKGLTAEGTATNKKDAEQRAAAAMINLARGMYGDNIDWPDRVLPVHQGAYPY